MTNFFQQGADVLFFVRIRLQDRRGECERAAGHHKGIPDVEQAGNDHFAGAEKVLDKRQGETADSEPADIDHRKTRLSFLWPLLVR